MVSNHPMQYITTHPMIYSDERIWNGFRPYDQYEGTADWYIKGFNPSGMVEKKRITIGNDVWLGKNVLIANYANIGNGVVAGAGAVITKDVPDYAVVVGVPARIIRYRFKEEQIKALNRISWWNWSDENIIERQDDFYLNIDEFIRKYDIL